MHAMYGPAGIIVLPDGSRLFAGSDRGDFEEGLPQGSPESLLAVCVLIQEAVQDSSTRRSLAAAVAPPSSWTIATAMAGQRRFSPPSVALPTVAPILGYTCRVDMRKSGVSKSKDPAPRRCSSWGKKPQAV